MEFEVTRAHLRHAVLEENWDLLDRLLEMDASGIDDTRLFTDTWGSWWGMVYHCVLMKHPDGLRVLLQRGADRELGTWGDCDPCTPLQLARESGQPELERLLTGQEPARYQRKTEPALPAAETALDRAVNRQGEVAQATGMVFQVENFLEPGNSQ